MNAVWFPAKFNREPKTGTAMNYVGVDIHKRYSFLSATDEQGHKLRMKGKGVGSEGGRF